MPTGTTPKASGTSWLAQLTVATRSGFVSIVVVPRACSIVIGLKSADAAGASSVAPASAEQPTRPTARADAALRASRVEVRDMGSSRDGKGCRTGRTTGVGRAHGERAASTDAPAALLWGASGRHGGHRVRHA
jgi:hypothetical protein